MNKLKRAVIKEELVALTGDFKRAVILNQYIYWSERVRDVRQFFEEETARDPGYIDDLRHGWIYKTASDMCNETMIDVSDTTMLKHIDMLVEHGWLSKRNNPRVRRDRTYQYRVNIHKIQADLAQLGYALEGYPLQLASPIPETGNGISETGNANPEIGEHYQRLYIKTTSEKTESTPDGVQTSLAQQKKKNRYYQIEAFCQAVGWDTTHAAYRQRAGRIIKDAAAVGVEPSPEQITAFITWWHANKDGIDPPLSGEKFASNYADYERRSAPSSRSASLPSWVRADNVAF